VKIEQDSGHAETEKTKRSGIASCITGVVHALSLSNPRSTMQSQIDWN